MPFGLAGRGELDFLRLGEGEKLSTLERIAFIAILVIFFVLDVVSMLTSSGVDLSRLALGAATTAAFALFLWSPVAATLLLGGVLALSFVTGLNVSALLASVVAAGLVMRLGRLWLIFGYLGGVLVTFAIIAIGDHEGRVNIGLYLIIATVSGAVGFALRSAFARGRRLAGELEERAEQERQAVLAERRWIAGELHDSIAHHLTVVAMHVQMLDDPDVSRSSQEAIRVAARKAMADLRFVIELADDGPRSAGPQTGDFAAAVDEAVSEFEDAGHAVALDGDPGDERIPRAAEIILARIMRESATNVLKHAGPGEIGIRLDVDDEWAQLVIRSPLPQTPRRDLPSSGTGLNRMAERVLGASGAFAAGEVDGSWEVSVRLPVA